MLFAGVLYSQASALSADIVSVKYRTPLQFKERIRMKVINQSYEILSVPSNLLETIEKAGRTCYKSENKITRGSAKRFVQMIINRGHHAVIEFGDIIVKFITNRGVTHELVRHRVCSFAQESTRYVRYDGEMEVIMPVWMDEDLLDQTGRTIMTRDDISYLPSDNPSSVAFEYWVRSCLESECAYRLLLDEGWRPEQAREVLPNSSKTEIVVKGNIREWRHIFSLRCSSKAHPQIRALMSPCLAELREKLPIVFDDISR